MASPSWASLPVHLHDRIASFFASENLHTMAAVDTTMRNAATRVAMARFSPVVDAVSKPTDKTDSAFLNAIDRGDLFLANQVRAADPRVETHPAVRVRLKGSPNVHMQSEVGHDVYNLHHPSSRQLAAASPNPRLLQAHLDKPDDPAFPALHLAAARAKPANVRTLLAGSSPDLADSKGQRALHTVGDAETAQALIDAGANPNFLDHGDWAPLHRARDGQVVRVLLKAGARPDPWALALARDATAVRLLTKAGVDPDAVLQEATREGHTTPVHVVLQEYAYGRTSKGAVNEIVKHLSPAAKRQSGLYAIAFSPETVRLLATHGVEARHTDECPPHEPCNALACAIMEGRADRLGALLKYAPDANVNSRAFLNHVPLMSLCAAAGDIECAKMLQRHDAPMKAEDSTGRTPLIYALLQPEFVAWLIAQPYGNVAHQDVRHRLQHVLAMPTDEFHRWMPQVSIMCAGGIFANIEERRQQVRMLLEE